MDVAINERISLSNLDRIYYDGRWNEPSSDGRLRLVNPATEEALPSPVESRLTDVERAIAAARNAFDAGPWPRMTPQKRADYLRAMYEALVRRSEELAHAWTLQIGTPFAMARSATDAAIELFAYYATQSTSFPWVEQHESSYPGHVGIVAREAVGVVAAIVPWNGPLQIAAVKIAPALLAGCTVILKPAPETPLEAYILAEAAEEAGLPAGVFNVVAADRAASELLVTSPAVDKVSFTGSSAAGRRIGALAGGRIARVTLELGGKSAAVVLDDFPLDEAAEILSQTAIRLSGQVCSNLTRVLVPETLHDRLCDAMVARFEKVKVGDPYDPSTDMGPLAMKRQLDRVEDYIRIGRKEGAALLTGGGRPSGIYRGYFIEPTLMGRVDNRTTIAREEIFGPVICAIPYKNVDHAVSLANDSQFGLGGAVFTRDADAAYRIARGIRTGTIGQNGSRTDLGIGYGGFKQSGVGREGGIQGIHNYVESKTIVLTGLPAAVK
ncbi:aldehyde dehydrogenase [Stakelama sp. CBK3Z-3]|uniref:Aldehyde dehydrogenase n=1 Tax=Stakelama flava TaxID=2860338 RepID=A0ABS6XRA7_9SPHN|nr:aldehyde dehydrogenase [Stakelama flava]MBW4332323.1 aldehyde dehydrogenase [Stakelama flava]